MDIGSVFKWDDYPKQKDGKLKARWFVYLGLSSILSNPQNVFLLPSTTQIELYEKGNRRQNHKKIRRFKSGSCGFEDESIIDIHFFENNWILDEFNKYSRDMEVKGKISNNILTQLYNFILTDYYIEKIIIVDIRRNLNSIGVFNLKKPN